MGMLDKYKKKAQIMASQYDPTPYWIRTDIPTLNWLIDPSEGRGLPGAQIIQITGDSSAGKSVLLASAIASVQKMGGLPIFYDCEGTAQENYMKIFGVDTENLIIGNVKEIKKKKDKELKLVDVSWTMEDTIDDICDKALQHLEAMQEYKNTHKGQIAWGKEEDGMFPPLVFFLDSIESTPSRFQLLLQDQYGNDPEKLDRALAGNNVRNNKSKMVKDKLQSIQSLMTRSGCTFIMTNQIFMKPGVMYGKDHQEGGGKGLRFHTNVILELTAKQKLYEGCKTYKEGGEGDITGVEVEAYTEKNKVGPPFRRSKFDIVFDQGISIDRYLFGVGLNLKLFVPATNEKTGKEIKGKYVYIKDKNAEKFSANTFLEYLERKPKLRTRLLQGGVTK